jgi:lipopolysaccharide transport system ATP-binding protein
MTGIAIRAEAIGKKYRVRHQQRERYTALRDVIADKVRGVFRPRPATAGTRRIDDFWALKDVSFDVGHGEVIGIIGRNGAGKSTLLKILSRITEPSEGRAEIEGRVGSLLEVGTGFHPELTGRENIYLNGVVLGMSRAEIRRKFDEIVAFAEVEKFLDLPVKRYSSGMHVRLAFAVAAHLEPEILIIDEVLAVGDAEFQRKCLGKMRDVGSSGRTVLFVSHQMNAVERLCQRVVWLQQGKVAGIFDDVRAGILRYLHESGGSENATTWRNPGNTLDHSHFRPNLFEIRSAAPDAEADDIFSNRYPLTLTIAGEIRTGDPRLDVGVAIYTDDGALLFWSFTRDAAEQEWPSLTPGPVRLSAQIPARWLNEGGYKAELLCGLHYSQWFLEPRGDVPSVTFSIRGGLSDSPYWDRKRPGVLAPVLRWQPAERPGAG